MGCKRIPSSLHILNFRRVQYILPEIVAQILGRSQIDLASREQFGQLQLHTGNAQQPRNPIRFELDEYVHIALRSEVLA